MFRVVNSSICETVAVKGNVSNAIVSRSQNCQVCLVSAIRKRGRVVEGSSLENCQGFTPFVSSNLTASAKPL